jgi:DNA polymerase III alpha subunit
MLKDLLAETYGVMVYQEDVIKVCHYFAGLDLSDADILRRAMSGKFRSEKEFERIKERFFVNCKARGYADQVTRELWRQMESFAGYSFSKAHSASYAVESFQSLYLKAHYPLEFMVGVINNFGGFYRLPEYINEIRRYGGTIHLPCVNQSHYLTRIDGADVYLGMVHILKLEQKQAFAIIEERQKNGAFNSLKNFIERIPIHTEQLILLIRVNALRFTGKSKKKLLWEAHFLKHTHSTDTNKKLFTIETRSFQLPPLKQSLIEDAYDEMELLGFPVTLTVFDLLKTSFRGEAFARDLLQHTGKNVRMVGKLVTIKNVKTVHNQWMHFGAFLDSRGEFFDTVHFPSSLKHYPFKGEGIYLILGKVTQEFGMPGITVEKMAKLPFKKDPRYG